MDIGWVTSRRGAVVGLVAGLALAGCNLGLRPVTVELKDPENFGFPLSPTGIASGDVDGDGDLDVVGVGTRGLAVLTNDGSGTLSIDFPASFHPGAISPSLVDVDADADLDLVSAVSSLSGSGLYVPSVRRNDGTGSFGSVEVIQADPPPGDLADMVASDVDQDGDVDVVGAFRFGQERHVGTYLNDGTGAFGALTTYALAFSSDTATPVAMTAGDIDGDGDDDVVATDTGDFTTPWGEVVDGTVAMVARNDGTGGFAAGPPIEVGSEGDFNALTPTLADLDDDGCADIAVGGTASVTTLLADCTGRFAAPQRTDLAVPRTIDFVTTADVDQDGKLDIVGLTDIINPHTGVVAYGDGAGGIAAVHEVESGTSLGGDGTIGRQVEITDLDGDGDPDILFLGGSLGVLENASDGRPTH